MRNASEELILFLHVSIGPSGFTSIQVEANRYAFKADIIRTRRRYSIAEGPNVNRLVSRYPSLPMLVSDQPAPCLFPSLNPYDPSGPYTSTTLPFRETYKEAALRIARKGIAYKQEIAYQAAAARQAALQTPVPSILTSALVEESVEAAARPQIVSSSPAIPNAAKHVLARASKQQQVLRCYAKRGVNRYQVRARYTFLVASLVARIAPKHALRVSYSSLALYRQ